LGTASAEYPLKRKREDPNFATQSHADQMDALVKATLEVLKKAAVKGEEIESIGIDTTGSSVIPVGEGLEPLDDYYLWCDHRALEEARQITELAHKEGSRASTGAAACIRTSGALPSCCTGCGIIPTSGTSSSLRWRIATWWRRRFAASPRSTT
jgi:sugar (pentulose or hexulose) kinase